MLRLVKWLLDVSPAPSSSSSSSSSDAEEEATALEDEVSESPPHLVTAAVAECQREERVHDYLRTVETAAAAPESPLGSIVESRLRPEEAREIKSRFMAVMES